MPVRFAIVAIISIFIYSCRVVDPAEEIPSYIRITSVSLTTSGNEGSNSHKITDAWIYIDGELIGAFEIPCNVPVLKEGPHTILIKAGIKQNGMSSLRAIYPFYKGWESTVFLTRGSVADVTPSFTYFPVTNLLWNCDFENSAGINYDDATQNYFPGLVDLVSGVDAFEGNSGSITLTGAENYCFMQSADSFYLDPGDEIYLELNYKCDQSFTIGLNFTPASSPEPIHLPWVEVEPSADWNKLYIRLNDALAGQPLNVKYRVFLQMSKPSSVTESHIWLDNLKFIN